MAERKLTRKQKKELGSLRRAREEARNPQRTLRQKATGWKIPLIFCAVILVVAAGVWGYRKVTAPAPLPIHEELLSLAAQSHINLDGDARGRHFKDELISAGRGFSPNYVKDEKTYAVALTALDQGRVDVAVTAVQVIRDGDKREKLLKELAQVCMEDCPQIPWAVFAVRNLIYNYPLAMDLTNRLNNRFEECKRSGWTPAPAPLFTDAAETPAGQAVQTAQAGNTQAAPAAPQEAAPAGAGAEAAPAAGQAGQIEQRAEQAGQATVAPAASTDSSDQVAPAAAANPTKPTVPAASADSASSAPTSQATPQ